VAWRGHDRPGSLTGLPSFALERFSLPGKEIAKMRLRHFYPLIGFVLQTIIVGYCFVIPRSCIAGFNKLSIGFAGTILGASLTYYLGLRAALRSPKT
jgi:hypothetical protein